MNVSRSTVALILLNTAWLAVASYFIARFYKQGGVTVRTEYVTNYVPIAKSARANTPTVVTNLIAGTNDFRWAQLESEDYRTYIQRLRAIGCPEQTIRDIIIADVDKLLAPRFQAASLQPRDLRYWEPIEQNTWDSAGQRDTFLKQRAIDFEKREVIRELLGIDLVGERLRSQGQDDYFGSRLTFLPEEKRARVRLVLDQFSDHERTLLEQQIEEGSAFTGKAELKRLEQEKNAALAQVLTPKERDQYDRWFSQSAVRSREAVYGMNATEEEFLKIYNLRRDFDLKYGDEWLGQADVAPQFHERLRQALGEERYADFLRAQDSEYRDLFAVTSRFGFPKTLAVELHDFTRAAAEQRVSVSADPNLTLAQKEAAQQAITEETHRTLKEALGEKAFRYYSRRK